MLDTVKSIGWKVRQYKILFAFFLYFLGSSTIACARILPDEIENELRRAGVAEESVGIVVQPVDGQKPILALNADMAFHPASTMKVVTTYAALELLGPHYRWKTNAYVTGKLEEGVLHGDLIIKGSGDPSFSQKDLWLFVREIQDSGIHEIRGNIVLDRSVFGKMGYDPAAFDDAPLKPYNAGPDGCF